MTTDGVRRRRAASRRLPAGAGWAVALGTVLATSCAPGGPLAPGGAFEPASVADFERASAATLPGGHEIVRLSWRSDDGQVQYSGSGAARIAPPDSMRADIAGAFGFGRATVIVTGDSVEARPSSAVDRVLPDRFALWAVLGIARLPPGATVVERAGDAARSLWRASDGTGRATVFEMHAGRLISVSRLVDGRTTSQLRLTRGADGEVQQASLTDLPTHLRLVVSVTARERSDGFPPEIWRLGP